MAITSLIAPSHKLYFLARHCRSRLALFIPVYVGEAQTEEHTLGNLMQSVKCRREIFRGFSSNHIIMYTDVFYFLLFVLVCSFMTYSYALNHQDPVLVFTHHLPFQEPTALQGPTHLFTHVKIRPLSRNSSLKSGGFNLRHDVLHTSFY